MLFRPRFKLNATQMSEGTVLYPGTVQTDKIMDSIPNTERAFD